MKFIADPPPFIWFVTGSPQLSAKAKRLFESLAGEKFLSTASILEIAIKTSLGKLALDKPLEKFLPEPIALDYFQPLDISLPHALRVAILPFHHRDPSDRMIIAQSLIEDWTILSNDETDDAYGVKRIC